MTTLRVSWRGAAEVAALLVLAACTPVHEPTRCEGDADCEAGFHCNSTSRHCVAAVIKQADAAAVQQPSRCMRDADCTTNGYCEMSRCEAGSCSLSPVPRGMRLPDQVVGDCNTLECDGSGHLMPQGDDGDQPAPDGNPCHERSCADGKIVSKDLPDGTDCNGGGVCKGGECSKCFEGADCTGFEDCTIKRVRCEAGKSICESTDEPISGKVCGMGKVCSDGECTDCRVNASCGDPDDCQVSRITSCNPRVCERTALTGTSCRPDASGQARVCIAGKCAFACDNASCAAPTSNACMQSTAVCARPDAEATCMPTMVADGTTCEKNGTCHAGACSHTALVNGDLSHALDGWTLSGDARNFRVFQDPNNSKRWTVSTLVEGFSGGAGRATGNVSQSFVVPNDAVALRFSVSGGEGTVELRDANGGSVEHVTGPSSDSRHVPVSWDLVARRGQMLTVSIRDDSSSDGTWSYVASTGFDVIRDTASALINADFHDGLMGWETSGDGMYFNVYNDWNSGSPQTSHDDAYGRRMSVSSYVYETRAPRPAVSAVGTLSQTFTVPADATALRFNVSGGSRASVALYDGASQLYGASAVNDDAIKVPVSFDLTPFRGKALKLMLDDEVSTGLYDYIGTSGFDIITAFNGP